MSVKSFQPCKDKLEKLLKDKLYYVGAVGITIIVIQVILYSSKRMFAVTSTITYKNLL